MDNEVTPEFLKDAAEHSRKIREGILSEGKRLLVKEEDGLYYLEKGKYTLYKKFDKVMQTPIELAEPITFKIEL